MKVDESNSVDFYADSSGDFFESLENDVNSMVKGIKILVAKLKECIAKCRTLNLMLPS